MLAARRTAPPATAGRWELPGGKVEPGETPEAAVVREIQEELGLAVTVSGWLTGSAAIGETHVLRAALARTVPGAGAGAVPGAGSPAEPRPTEHDQVRWLAADELDDVDWLEPDRPFLAELARVLGILEGVRGIFFDEDHARAAARRLTTEGYDAAVVRERLAGEDDDEDHPWAVLTDAPEMVLDLLVDEYDGWLDPDDGAGAGPGAEPAPPLDLPRGPRRTR